MANDWVNLALKLLALLAAALCVWLAIRGMQHFKNAADMAGRAARHERDDGFYMLALAAVIAAIVTFLYPAEVMIGLAVVVMAAPIYYNLFLKEKLRSKNQSSPD